MLEKIRNWLRVFAQPGKRARALQVALNRDSEQKAAAIRIRAERKTGELLAEGKKSGARASAADNLKRGPKSGAPTSEPPKLSDLGVSRDQSSQWQKLAAIPKADFEEALSAPGVPTTEGVIRAASAPKIHVDRDALWAYDRISELESQ